MFDNENIVYKNIDGVEILQFKKLLKYENIINHAYCIGKDRNFRTGRNDGKVSCEEYEKAVKDYRSLCNALNLEYSDLVKTKQAHTDSSKIVDSKKIGKPDFETFEKTDGLITDKEKLILATTNADCILILFFDPVKKVIANVHSGWKGTLQRISVKTLEKMKEKYGCKEKDIIVCMCPSIRKCHFEVGDEIYKEFYNEFSDINQEKDIFEKINGKWHIDTILINRLILKNKGLLEKNIIDSGVCSVCSKDYMHSFRVEKEKYGLNTAIITLK